MKNTFLLFMAILFTTFTVIAGDSVDEEKVKRGELGYFGDISQRKMGREDAEATVLRRFDKILEKTTRKAVIKPNSNANTISVEIIELDGSPFYRVDIDRKTGLSAYDKKALERENKIKADLEKNRQQAKEREEARKKYAETENKKSEIKNETNIEKTIKIKNEQETNDNYTGKRMLFKRN